MKKTLQLIFGNLFVMMLLLFIIEIILQLVGYKAGHYQWQLLSKKQLEKVEVLPQFFTDSTGMFRANLEWDWDSTYQFNAEGFRSRAFDDTLNAPKNKRVLLFGDSFTWGAKAIPIQNCYANLLDKHTSYTTYNTGIPGVGPDHYSLMAEKYIPLLKPGKVLLFFYIGNDLLTKVMEEELYPIRPNENLYHIIKDAGWISAHANGKYIKDPILAYETHLKKYSEYSGLQKNPLDCSNQLCVWASVLNYSILGTWLYNSDFMKTMIANDISNKPVAYTYLSYLNKIKNICQEHGSVFYLFVIPDRAKPIDHTLFKGFEPYILENLVESDYRDPPNVHFNNQGHLKYYEFVKTVIDN